MSEGISSGIVVRPIEPGTPEYDEAAEVRYDALYREWGLPRSLVADADPAMFRHLAAFDHGRIVGYARVLLGVDVTQIFQVAVAPDRRNEGIGVALVDELLRIAVDAGRTEVVLDAREHVIGFYERLGFVAEGPEFLSERTKTPHRRMRRSVGGV